MLFAKVICAYVSSEYRQRIDVVHHYDSYSIHFLFVLKQFFGLLIGVSFVFLFVEGSSVNAVLGVTCFID